MSADVDPWDEDVATAYFAWIAENYAGEVLLNKQSLEECLERQWRWPEFLLDLAARRPR